MTVTATPSRAGLYGIEQRRPLYSRVPGLYFRTPAWVKALARRAWAARQPDPPALIHAYLEALDALPSADGAPVPLLLTHDVDTARGYANLPRLLAVEERLGLRSLSLIVTHRYRWAPAALATLVDRGHAFGVHDTTHDNQLAYLPEAAIERRLRAAQQALGALDCGAFRAPAFLRTPALYRALARSVRIDLSANDSALLWPHPGDGTGSPFPLRHGRTLCVPTTLPRDGEMLALGLRGGAIGRLCREKAEKLWRVGAPAVLLTHPDPGFLDSADAIGGYEELLRWFTECGLFAIGPPAACLAELERRAWPHVALADA
jgi:hypothetical protein